MRYMNIWLSQHLVILWLTSRFTWYLIPPLKNPPSNFYFVLKYNGEHCLKVFSWDVSKIGIFCHFICNYNLQFFCKKKKKNPSSSVSFPWKELYKSQHKCLILSFYLLMFRAEINKLFPCNRPDSKYFRLCRPCGLCHNNSTL